MELVENPSVEVVLIGGRRLSTRFVAVGAAAADTIVPVSAEKLNAASPYIIAPVTEASGIIVERGVPKDATEVYEKMGITVTRA